MIVASPFFLEMDALA